MRSIILNPQVGGYILSLFWDSVTTLKAYFAFREKKRERAKECVHIPLGSAIFRRTSSPSPTMDNFWCQHGLSFIHHLFVLYSGSFPSCLTSRYMGYWWHLHIYSVRAKKKKRHWKLYRINTFQLTRELSSHGRSALQRPTASVSRPLCALCTEIKKQQKALCLHRRKPVSLANDRMYL